MEKQEPVFVKGLYFNRPRENAPKFIKGSLQVKPEEFICFMRENFKSMSPKGYMTFDLKESKEGKLYLQLNTWKPMEKPNLGNNEFQALRDNHNTSVARQNAPSEEKRADDDIYAQVPF